MMLRIMTHNQWKNDDNLPAWVEQGKDCSAAVRMRGFTRVYAETLPDIIGGQEVSATMADLLIRYTAENGMRYALLWGRDTPILYRPDKLELVDSEFSLYPDEFPGHEGVFNNSQTKSYAIAVFRIKESGKLLIFASTHLWWKSGKPSSPDYQPYSDEARAYQISLLITRIDALQEKYACPAIIVGDLNADYQSLAVGAAFARGFVHAHDVATEYADETMAITIVLPGATTSTIGILPLKQPSTIFCCAACRRGLFRALNASHLRIISRFPTIRRRILIWSFKYKRASTTCLLFLR